MNNIQNETIAEIKQLLLDLEEGNLQVLVNKYNYGYNDFFDETLVTMSSSLNGSYTLEFNVYDKRLVK